MPDETDTKEVLEAENIYDVTISKDGNAGDVPIGVNGVIKYFPRGRTIKLTESQLGVLEGSGYDYSVWGDQPARPDNAPAEDGGTPGSDAPVPDTEAGNSATTESALEKAGQAGAPPEGQDAEGDEQAALRAEDSSGDEESEGDDDLSKWAEDDAETGKKAGDRVSKDDLIAIAKREGVEVETDDNMADLRRKISEKRANA